jgi:transposase
MQIVEALSRGLHAQRIYQDLVCEHGFAGSYSSVQRFVRSLRKHDHMPFRRMETASGEEAQIDFGQGTWFVGPDGKRKRPWLFRIVLSHSRKAYSEVVWKQDAESFIRALENAFRAFGGVPKTLIPDNLKAVVTKADWYDPDINPKILAFCEHYGTVMLPTKVRTPRHKGKVERAVDYAQENALRGHTFPSLNAQNAHLREWEKSVADTRIHGTTRRQVAELFAEEAGSLKPLPPSLFPCFREGTRKCGMDGHIEVDKAYYSVPPEFTRRNVFVRWDGRMVRVLHPSTMAEVRVHVKVDPGKFSTNQADICKEKINSLEHGEHYLMKQIALVGDDVHQWAKQMVANRGIPGVRVLQGALHLTRKYKREDLQYACREAIKLEAWHLKDLRGLLTVSATSKPEQAELPLEQNHDISRPLKDYALSDPLNQSTHH